jgi:hypothetical protein
VYCTSYFSLTSYAQKGPNRRAAALTMRLKESALAIGMLAPVSHPSSPVVPTSNGVSGTGSFNAATIPNLSTDGIDMEEWEPEDDSGSRHVSFTIWDFAGQEVDISSAATPIIHLFLFHSFRFTTRHMHFSLVLDLFSSYALTWLQVTMRLRSHILPLNLFTCCTNSL